jgi:hypothetical protein
MRYAADKAADTARLGFDYLRESPVANYLNTGSQANSQIASLLGVGGGGGGGGGAAPAAAQQPFDQYGSYVSGSDDLEQAFTRLTPEQKDYIRQQGFNPDTRAGFGEFHYSQMGQGEGRELPTAPTAAPTNAMGGGMSAQQGFQNFLGSTGFQFQVNQGNRGIMSTAGAAGLRGSGATGKGLVNYGQNMGLNYFTNYLGQLGSLSQQGLSAGATIGSAASQAGAQGASAISQGYGQAAQAQSAGQVAGADLRAQGRNDLYAGIGGAAQSAWNAFAPGKKGF